MDWLRVASNLRDHPKARKLGAVLGVDRAHSFVVDLWGWAAKFYPTGDLTDCDALDIALACGWSGDPEIFLDALISCRWLDSEDGLLVVHDWEEHQGKLIEQKQNACARSRAWRNRMKQEREANKERTRTLRVRTLLRTNVTNERTDEEKKETMTAHSGDRVRSDAHKVVDAFVEAFTKKNGAAPVIEWARDVKLAKSILSGRTVEEACSLAREFVESPPMWNREQLACSFRNLTTAVDKIILRRREDGR